MAIDLQPPERIVLVRFSDTTARGVFSDVLRFTDTEFAATTGPQRRAMAQERRDAWLAALNAPAAPTPTAAELEAHVTQQERQLVEAEARIEELRPRPRARFEARLVEIETRLADMIARFVARFGPRT